MTDKEKEQMALEIYQQLINTLTDVSEKAEIINIVNTLIEENGQPRQSPKYLPSYAPSIAVSSSDWSSTVNSHKIACNYTS